MKDSNLLIRWFGCRNNIIFVKICDLRLMENIDCMGLVDWI